MSKQLTKGFTIIELIIVIVVIGILAAITIVSYRGTQEKARATALVTGIRTFEDGFKLLAAQQNVGTWWADTVFNGSNNPSMSDLIDVTPGTGTPLAIQLRKYVSATPIVPGLDVNWIYDNDLGSDGSRVRGSCGTTWNGVILAAQNVPTKIGQAVDKMIDDGNDTCGDVRVVGTTVLYQLSYGPDMN